MHKFSLETLLDETLIFPMPPAVTLLKVGNYLLVFLKNAIIVQFCGYYGYFLLSSLAPDDFIALYGSFQINANTPLQCVPISIKPDSVNETGQECFTFSISTSTTFAGLTLRPLEAEVCITDTEGIVL